MRGACGVLVVVLVTISVLPAQANVTFSIVGKSGSDDGQAIAPRKDVVGVRPIDLEMNRQELGMQYRENRSCGIPKQDAFEAQQDPLELRTGGPFSKATSART